ncbi:MAG: hypothetical protein H0Z38_03215 [Firmicutes bacterium]|nr:hypothetical protein [Bacillota bacterium]
MNWLKKIGYFLLAVLGAIVAWLLWKNPAIDLWREVSERVDREAEREMDAVRDIEKNQEKRTKKSKWLSEWLDRLPVIVFVILIGCAFPITVLAETSEIPSDYDQLLQYYREMSQIAAEYKKLYEEAEKDVSRLIESNKNLQKLVQEQQKIIESLFKKDRLAISAGVTFTQSGYGFLTALTYTF